METSLTPEMLSLIAQLGELVKADARCRDIVAAIDAYEHSEDLNGLIASYNAQQDVLAEAYNAAEDPGEDFKKSVQARIDALYDEIVGHPVYAAYVDAKEAFDDLTNEIYGELQYVITGTRPCSHDCSSCGSDCGHEHHHHH